MNPYEVLGVDPYASPDSIEASYHRLVRAHHPDLHQGASPEELAEAEAQTREINQAMALIRAGWRPGPNRAGRFHYDAWDEPGQPGQAGQPGSAWPPPQGAPVSDYDPPPRPGSWSDGFRTDATTDWFGNPTRPRRRYTTVACPLCGEDFDDARVLHIHLVEMHHLHEGVFPAPARQRRDRFRWLRWIPVPQLTLTAFLFVYLTLVGGLVPSPWTIPGLWLGFGLYLAAMIKALSPHRAS